MGVLTGTTIRPSGFSLCFADNCSPKTEVIVERKGTTTPPFPNPLISSITCPAVEKMGGHMPVHWWYSYSGGGHGQVLLTVAPAGAGHFANPPLGVGML